MCFLYIFPTHSRIISQTKLRSHKRCGTSLRKNSYWKNKSCCEFSVLRPTFRCFTGNNSAVWTCVKTYWTKTWPYLHSDRWKGLGCDSEISFPSPTCSQCFVSKVFHFTCWRQTSRASFFLYFYPDSDPRGDFTASKNTVTDDSRQNSTKHAPPFTTNNVASSTLWFHARQVTKRLKEFNWYHTCSSGALGGTIRC